MKPDAVVVDSSAIIAILRDESERQDFEAVLDTSTRSVCSIMTFVESFMVATSRKTDTPPVLYLALLRSLKIDLVATDETQSLAAAEAFLRFGKGRHPARLNLGDCFSYALAKSLNAPLLYKGEDFAKTDIASAIVAGAKP